MEENQNIAKEYNRASMDKDNYNAFMTKCQLFFIIKYTIFLTSLICEL